MDYGKTVVDPGFAIHQTYQIQVCSWMPERNNRYYMYAYIPKGEMIQSSLYIQKLLHAWE